MKIGKPVPFSQCLLGLVHLERIGVQCDPSALISQLSSATKQGYAAAQLALGRLYREGLTPSKLSPQLA
jgi:TPR repeat protein